MQLSDAVRKRIIELSLGKNITLHKLSLDSGIPYSTLNSFLNKKSKNLTLGTLLHLCEGLEIELNEFFSDKIFDDVVDE